METYKKVTNFNQLLDLNVDFIEGKINWTPYHQQPLQNVGRLKQELINVNQNGFLTLGGQCALETPQREQKLFLDGYLDTNLVRDFIKYLKGFKKFEFFIEFPNKQIKTNIRNWKVLNVGQGGYYNSLTRVKETPQDSSSNWKDDFILPFRDLSYITLTGWKGFDNILEILKNYAFVHLQHRSFHNKHNDIYPLINGFLKSKKSKFGENSSRYQKFKSFVLKKKKLISLIGICISLLTAGYFVNKKLLKQAQVVADTGTPSQVDNLTNALKQQVEMINQNDEQMYQRLKNTEITTDQEEMFIKNYEAKRNLKFGKDFHKKKKYSLKFLKRLKMDLKFLNKKI